MDRIDRMEKSFQFSASGFQLLDLGIEIWNFEFEISNSAWLSILSMLSILSILSLPVNDF
jgi:hypothetical protein